MAQEHVAAVQLATLDGDDDFAPCFGATRAVNAGNGGDDDAVAATEQICHRFQAQSLNFFVDLALFFDEKVAAGDVCFGLVVVVVADEVGDGVVGEKVAEFGVQLGGEGFVVRHNQRGALGLLNDVGDGECFARSRRAEKGLQAFFGV